MNILEMTGRKPENLVQKVLQYNDDLKVSFPGYASEKLDGVFAVAVVDGDSTYFFSRTGKEYTSIKHINLTGLRNYTGYNVFIGELYAPELCEDVISGYARDTKQQHKELKFYIHDLLALEEFKQGKSKNTYLQRNEILKQSSLYFNSNYVILHYSIFIQNLQDLKRWANWLIYNNKEGVVYRYSGAYYEAGKRNADMIKIKRELTIDLKIVMIEKGVGKCAGVMGKIIAVDGDGKRVVIGTGFDDKQRRDFWEFREMYSGAIITVKAMQKSKNGVLRQPVFVCLRDDKIKPDKISEVL